MALPKITVNPSDIVDQFQEYFNEFLESQSLTGYTLKTPVVIRYNEDTDEKIFITGFFKNTNSFDVKEYSTYFIYYDGCSCPHLIEDPTGRYTVSELSRNSLTHLWSVYQQCETELNNN